MVHTRVPCTHEAAIHAPYASTQNHYGERETEKERQRERKGEGRRHAPALVAVCYNVRSPRTERTLDDSHSELDQCAVRFVAPLILVVLHRVRSHPPSVPGIDD